MFEFVNYIRSIGRIFAISVNVYCSDRHAFGQW